MNTVIHTFEDHASAQQAADRLAQAGIPRVRIHLQEPAGATAGGIDTGPGAPTAEERDRGVLSSIGHFVVSALGVDNPPGQLGDYAEAARRGMCVMVVDAEDEVQALRADAVMQESGAIDLKARASGWR